LFGTGLKRGLEDTLSAQLLRLCQAAVARITCDLPSGVETDSGQCLSPVPKFDATVTFGALKPAHLLHPAMYRCGRVVLADIGIEASSEWHEIAAPVLPPLEQGLHKYTRGLVHALAGKMPGAIALAATAAARTGAGYVRVSTSKALKGLPAAIAQVDTADVNDPRIGCLLVGPGMGDIPQILTLALTSRAPKVIDADAITHLGDPGRLKGQDTVITPHEGEFRKLFGEIQGGKPEQALEAARRSGAVVVYKGADTLVASPDGRLGFRPPAPGWLASAGTGDVLSGIIAALRARGMPAFEAACAGVWLHARAAEIAGPDMIADDLARAIPRALDSLR
jgi:ADP-dependent NAD(P)H-hydrate dehydratase / NAD(P)H-hydrate epimerase